MACGCQVQGHGNVEGQGEDGEVPLAEDGAQGTGKDGTGGRNMRDLSDAAGLGTRPHCGREPWFTQRKAASCLPFLGFLFLSGA